MARDFIFRLKNGEALPPKDPSGYRVLLDNQGSFKLLTQNGEIINQPSTQYDYVVVDISSSDILSMDSTPIILLPAPGVGKYYDVDKIIFEFSYNSLPYNTANNFLNIYNGRGTTNIYAALISDTLDAVCITKLPTFFDSIEGGLAAAPLVGINTALTMSAGAPITSGNGTLKAKIYYKTMTFTA
jgi:hypothetical protein